ncbi:MAG: hypothetical protein ABSG91_04520 [Syntrophobacteraceae bacterium]
MLEKSQKRADLPLEKTYSIPARSVSAVLPKARHRGNRINALIPSILDKGIEGLAV